MAPIELCISRPMWELMTFLENIASGIEDIDSQIHISELHEVEGWDDSQPNVALDEIIAAFRRIQQRQEIDVGDTVTIPAHAEDTADLTGEYVLYSEDEYGKRLYYLDSESEMTDSVLLDDACRSRIAYRLRYWDSRFRLPNVEAGDVIDDRPPYRTKPISASRPMEEDEYSQFVEDTLEFVLTELSVDHGSNYENEVSKGLVDGRGGGGCASSSDISSNNGYMNLGLPRSGTNSRHPRYVSLQQTYGIYEFNTVVILWETISDEIEYIDGRVTNVYDEEIRVDLNFGNIDPSEVDHRDIDQASIRVVKRGVAERREYEAFDEISRNSRPLLQGDDEMLFASPIDLEFDPALTLNPYQEQAAVDALCSDDVFCIHGPPGTGKTRTLVSIVENAVKEGDTVLVCAHSNQAVDNIVAGESQDSEPDHASLHGIAQRMDEDGSRGFLARVGSTRSEVSQFILARYYADSDQLDGWIDSTNIIACTTNMAAIFEERSDVTFDLVVIDEATQASGPATAVPFGMGNRVRRDENRRIINSGDRTVLAGDHLQLPPFVSDPEMRDENRHISLFEHLLNVYGDDLAQTLFRQYRMHEDIASFASEEFYDGKLEHAQPNKSATIDNLEAIVAIDHDFQDEQSPGSNSRSNPEEAGIVAAQVQTALNHDVSPENIGVIAGYSDQREVIKSNLRKEFTEEIHSNVDVETIDKFQGGQREVIIVSFIRSNPEYDSGFLESPPNVARKRLNVAITRAKKRLVLIGDWDTMSQPGEFRDESDSCSETYARLLEHIREVGEVYSN